MKFNVHNGSSAKHRKHNMPPLRIKMLLDAGAATLNDLKTAATMSGSATTGWYYTEPVECYRNNRENGDEDDSPRYPFPCDGRFYWDVKDNTSKVFYEEGHGDKAWMEKKDRNYVLRLEQEGNLDNLEPNLLTEAPALYAEVTAMPQPRPEAEARLQAKDKEREEHLFDEKLGEPFKVLNLGGDSGTPEFYKPAKAAAVAQASDGNIGGEPGADTSALRLLDAERKIQAQQEEILKMSQEIARLEKELAKQRHELGAKPTAPGFFKPAKATSAVGAGAGAPAPRP